MPDEMGRRPIPARELGAAQHFARTLARSGVTPNMVSGVGLVAGVGAGLLLGLTAPLPAASKVFWIVAAVLILARGLANMFDGMVAVEEGRATPTGILWNELPDRISDVAILVGAGYGLGGSFVAGWLTACLAMFVSYVRTLGTVAGATPDFSGPFAKQQRMFSVAVLAALLAITPTSWHFEWGPGATWGPMAVLLWIMVAGIVWTAMRRLRRIAKEIGHTDHQ